MNSSVIDGSLRHTSRCAGRRVLSVTERAKRRAAACEVRAGSALTSQPPQWQVEPVHLVGLKWAATECQRGREATEACETECEMRSETFDNSRVNSGDKSARLTDWTRRNSQITPRRQTRLATSIISYRAFQRGARVPGGAAGRADAPDRCRYTEATRSRACVTGASVPVEQGLRPRGTLDRSAYIYTLKRSFIIDVRLVSFVFDYRITIITRVLVYNTSTCRCTVRAHARAPCHLRHSARRAAGARPA